MKTSKSSLKYKGITYYDLTHPTPMFQPLDGDVTRPDMDKPLSNSQPTSGHGGFQGVRVAKPNLDTRQGFFQWGYFFLDEHYATHIDSQCHYITTNPDLTIDKPDRRTAVDFTLEDLIGPIVYIDIQSRVDDELAKNEGKPSPDPAITNFANDSVATLRQSDLEKVEEHIVDSVFIVINTGWDRFFWGEPPENGWLHPYTNGLNHPGVTPEVVDWLVDLEDKKGIRINGFVADNIAIESGHSLLGEGGSVLDGENHLNGPYLHAIGLQRGWKLVENATNLEVLSGHAQGSGTILIGASKIAGVSGAPARLVAMFNQ